MEQLGPSSGHTYDVLPRGSMPGTPGYQLTWFVEHRGQPVAAVSTAQAFEVSGDRDPHVLFCPALDS